MQLHVSSFLQTWNILLATRDQFDGGESAHERFFYDHVGQIIWKVQEILVAGIFKKLISRWYGEWNLFKFGWSWITFLMAQSVGIYRCRGALWVVRWWAHSLICWPKCLFLDANQSIHRWVIIYCFLTNRFMTWLFDVCCTNVTLISHNDFILDRSLYKRSLG